MTESELEARLRQLGWVVITAPILDVALRWPEALYTHEWRVRKGPAEIRSGSTAELARLVLDFELAVGGAPPKRKRRRKITLELVRCTWRHPYSGSYCGALVWLRGGATTSHAATHGVAAPDEIEALFLGPKTKLGAK